MKFCFHPEAEKEYADAIRYYLAIDARVAKDFIGEIEYSMTAIRRNPMAWRLVDADIRRYLVHRFPFGIYYTFGNGVMHLSRKPDYWKSRQS